MPSFVIHEHSGWGQTHYDLMLELGQAMATWQFARSPLEMGAEPLPALRLPDHRLHYLTYQGPVSKGRGQVRRIEEGSYALVSREEGRWLIDVQGRVLSGRIELACQSEGLWLARRV